VRALELTVAMVDIVVSFWRFVALVVRRDEAPTG
jgi:hypothetical protein